MGQTNDVRLSNESYHVRIYDSFDSSLEDIWKGMEDSCDHYVFQGFEWLSHWQRTIGNDSFDIKPAVVVVSNEKECLALFPFGIRKSFGARILQFLGGEQSDYNAPLILPKVFTNEQFHNLWEKILDILPAHDVRYFIRMPGELGGFRNPFLEIDSSICEGFSFSAALSSSWDHYQSKLPAKFQKDNARMRRRLSEMGELEFKVATTASEFCNIIETMFTQKERRYKETGARNILADASTRLFYRELAGAVSKRAYIHISALILDGEILATHLGAVCKGRFYYLFPTYAAAKWAKFSPGRLLLANLVQWAISNRLHTFDFTVGGEAYKEIWCSSNMPLYRVVKPLTIHGHFFAKRQAIIQWIKTNPRVRFFIMSIFRSLRR